jgi:hypothetical protein
MTDQPDAENSSWQHTTLIKDRQPCPRQDFNPQFQQSRGRRPTPETAPQLESVHIYIYIYIYIYRWLSGRDIYFLYQNAYRLNANRNEVLLLLQLSFWGQCLYKLSVFFPALNNRQSGHLFLRLCTCKCRGYNPSLRAYVHIRFSTIFLSYF